MSCCGECLLEATVLFHAQPVTPSLARSLAHSLTRVVIRTFCPTPSSDSGTSFLGARVTKAENNGPVSLRLVNDGTSISSTCALGPVSVFGVSEAVAKDFLSNDDASSSSLNADMVANLWPVPNAEAMRQLWTLRSGQLDNDFGGSFKYHADKQAAVVRNSDTGRVSAGRQLLSSTISAKLSAAGSKYYVCMTEVSAPSSLASGSSCVMAVSPDDNEWFPFQTVSPENGNTGGTGRHAAALLVLREPAADKPRVRLVSTGQSGSDGCFQQGLVATALSAE